MSSFATVYAQSRKITAAKPVSTQPEKLGASKPDALRIQKKREGDRRSQRLARERTRSRIAYLEGLAQELSARDGSDQVALLMKQVAELQRERDSLAKTLQDISGLAAKRQPSTCNATDQSLSRKPPLVAGPQDDEGLSDDVDGLPSIEGYTFADSNVPCDMLDMNPPLPYAPLEQPEDHSLFMVRNSNVAFAQVVEPVHYETTKPRQIPTVSPAGRSTDAFNLSQELVSDSQYADPIVPRTKTACSCSMIKRPTHSGPAINLWRYANETLMERFKGSDAIHFAEDAMSEDIPVRAMIEGWDAVSRRTKLTMSWQILRRIDETLFSTCQKKERLAILRLMHLLLQFHRDPSPDRCAKLPPWYIKRPSQTVAHSYAINFFAWPGLRERFVFYQHQYCSNIFWHLFCASLRIQWAYEFRDCYTRNAETGAYMISPLFDERIRDIRSWAMGPKIFQRFPEFYGDLPACDHMPSPVSNIAQYQLATLAPNDQIRVWRIETEEEDSNVVVDNQPTNSDFDFSFLENAYSGIEFVNPGW